MYNFYINDELIETFDNLDEAKKKMFDSFEHYSLVIEVKEVNTDNFVYVDVFCERAYDGDLMEYTIGKEKDNFRIEEV